MLVACGGNPTGDIDARPPWPDAPPDASTEPYVVAVSPIDGALGVEGDEVVTVEFSEPLDPATVGPTTFTMVGPAGAVPGTVTYTGFTTVRFQPTGELTMLESYSFAIAADVADLDGHPLGVPYTWTFTVAERWWRPPQAVQLVDGAGYPRVGCDGAGNVIAVWQQPGAGVSDLYTSRRVGSTWDAPMALDADSYSVVDSELVVLPSGDAIVGWYQSGVWARQYRAGSGWEQPTELATSGIAPSVALNAAGDAMVVWLGSLNIMAARFTRSTGWETPTTISTALSSGGTPVALADSGGVVLWQQNAGGSKYRLWTREYDAATGWGDAVQLLTEPGGVGTLAMTPSGDAIAVWGEYGATYDVVARRYAVGEGWLDTSLLYSDPEIGGSYPRIAIDAAGNAAVIWAHGYPHNDVVVRSFDVENNSWEEPTTWQREMEPEEPTVAIDNDGHVFAAWNERDAFIDDDIIATRPTADGLVVSKVETLGSSQGPVALAACPGGTAIVLWKEDGGLYASDYR